MPSALPEVGLVLSSCRCSAGFVLGVPKIGHEPLNEKYRPPFGSVTKPEFVYRQAHNSGGFQFGGARIPKISNGKRAEVPAEIIHDHLRGFARGGRQLHNRIGVARRRVGAELNHQVRKQHRRIKEFLRSGRRTRLSGVVAEQFLEGYTDANAGALYVYTKQVKRSLGGSKWMPASRVHRSVT